MPIYECPISYEIPRVPVITNTGITYDFVPLAQSLLREETDNAKLDPITRDPISILIYNFTISKMNNKQIEKVLPLSTNEKNEIAYYYQQLRKRYPELQMHQIDTLEGMQELIDAPEEKLIAYQPQFQPGYVDEAGQTSLYLAARDGLIDIVRNLLRQNGINPNQVTTKGKTPLYIAVQNRHLTTITALLADPRIDPNQAKTDGKTPLYIAAQKGHLSSVTALLADPRIDPNQTTTDGATPLLIAAYKGHLSSVTALLADPRIDPNQTTTDGTTPLYTAALFAHINVMRALLRHANIQAPTVSVADQQRYPKFLDSLLSNKINRDYYLNQIIKNSEFMQGAFIKNPLFFTELAKHRNQLWECLRDPASLNLDPGEHRALLNTILTSQKEPNEAQHHPLYTLFKTPQSWHISSFFKFKPTILEEMQTLLDTNYSQPNP